MRRPFVALVAAGAALAFATAAFAVPPTLTSVTQQNRHASATFSAAKASDATIYLASKPDRATDGSFLQENIKELDLLTSSEIQSGRWEDENQIDPGTYWVMLRASPNFEICFLDNGTIDPSCADGYSNLLMLTVPKPTVRYTTHATVFRYLGRVDLQVTATPLGEKQAYRLCYRVRSGRTRCLNGSLDRFSWNSSADDELSVSTRNLRSITTFTWYVAGKKVAAKRVRVR